MGKLTLLMLVLGLSLCIGFAHAGGGDGGGDGGGGAVPDGSEANEASSLTEATTVATNLTVEVNSTEKGEDQNPIIPENSTPGGGPGGDEPGPEPVTPGPTQTPHHGSSGTKATPPPKAKPTTGASVQLSASFLAFSLTGMLVFLQCKL